MGGWVVVGVIILIAVVSAVAQVLKNQKEPPARPRPAVGRPAGGGVKSGAGDIDRFLAELDKLRQKQADAGGAPPPPKPAPVVVKAKPKPAVAKPAKPRRVADPVPTRPVVSPSRVDALPPAVVEPLPSAAPVVTAPPRSSERRSPPQSSPFGRELELLLSNPRAVPMAVVLHEILGPPKCKQ